MDAVDDIPLLPKFRDAIRRIKQQKQRPGLDRVSQTLKTHHGVNDLRVIKAQLDEAVRRGLLFPVWTKGLQCYKDPQDLRTLRKYNVDSIMEVRRAVKAAVREIGDQDGSTAEIVESYIRQSFEVKTQSLPMMVAASLDLMVKRGTLVRVGQDRFKTSTGSAAKFTQQLEDEEIPSASENGTVEVVRSPRRKYVRRKEPPRRYTDGMTDIETDEGTCDMDMTGSDSDPTPSAAGASVSQPGTPAQALLSSNRLPNNGQSQRVVSNATALVDDAYSSTSPISPAISKPTGKPRGRPRKNRDSDQVMSAEPLSVRSPSTSPAKFASLFPRKNPPRQPEEVRGFSEGIMDCNADAPASSLYSRPVFLLYQCWCCGFYTPSQDEFLKHLEGEQHTHTTMGRTVRCVRCCRQSKDGRNIIEHLKQRNFHNDGTQPAVLLNFVAKWTLTSEFGDE